MVKTPLANWNGEKMPLDEVRVSVLDRAFLFGDAVYEALRVYQGKPWLCRRHMARLERSMREIRIPGDAARIERRMLELIDHSRVSEGFVYIQVTRGVAPRTHKFPTQPTAPNELIYVQELAGDPYAELRPTGIRVITHPDNRWARRDIKSVNLLGNCLASQAAADAGCHEAILVEPDGKITEGTHTSVFAVKSGCLLTAPNSHHILPGITRGLVLELAARTSIPLQEHAFRKEDLATIDELFLTGTSTEVLSIVSADGRPVGSGEPGPIAKTIHQAYKSMVADWLADGAPIT